MPIGLKQLFLILPRNANIFAHSGSVLFAKENLNCVTMVGVRKVPEKQARIEVTNCGSLGFVFDVTSPRPH